MALAERLNAPVLTTFKGKGLVSDHHPLGCGVLGRSGTPIASWFMNEADLLLVMGASFSNHTGITPKLPIIQVDSDPMALGRFHPVEVPLQGDIAVTAGLLLDALEGAEPPEDRRPEIARRWAGWRAEKARREADDRGRGLSAASVFAVMSPAGARGRGDRRGRRQQHLLVRALLRVRAPVGADERLPRLDRLRLPGGDGRLVRGAGAARSSA